MDCGGDFHIVVTVDSQYILDHIAWACHIDAIGGHLDGDILLAGSHNLHLKALEDGDHGVGGDVFTHKPGGVIEIKGHFCRLDH